jgi:hypothetical protein
MPNDLVIRPASPVAQRASPAVPDTPIPAPAPVPKGDALPNPTMRLDPALGLVVIEFHNDSGEVTTSIPAARQLDAYRTARDLNIAPKINRADNTGHVHLPETRKV